MIRLVEIFVALIIVFVLAIVFAIALPDHRHTDRAITLSSPVRQIYDVLDGFRTYPSWAAVRAYDPRVRFDYYGPERGSGAKINWVSGDGRVGNGSLTIIPDPVQDKQVRWAIDNNWKGTNKIYTFDIEPAENGKTVKVTLGYDVDYGWDLLARYSGLYLGGDPATQIQLHLTELEKLLTTIPNVDYKDQNFELKDVAARPILFVSTQAKRTLDDVADATDKALTAIQAAVKKNNLSVTGPRMTVTTNWGDENYEFDIALPVDRNTDLTLVDPVKTGQSYGGKALTNSFTGSPAQLPLVRLLLKAYAYTHGYIFDESSQGPGRFYDELTTPDPQAAEDNQSFVVYLPVQIQQ
ncbi:MAG TPA: hypothetical protein VIE67_12905 [Rudaea sp.]|jgi:hypothetical protein|uniref:hypothetical protein n=1 Tax=Rudaea sp. TaxID=2136325 RepID=UPI002F92A318